MYTKLQLENVHVGEAKIGRITIEGKYKLEEIVGLYELSKTVIKEMPETLNDVEAVFNKVNDIKKAEAEDVVSEKFKEFINGLSE